MARNQVWLTIAGRTEEALNLARQRFGDDWKDQELLRRIVDEWLLIERGERVAIEKRRLHPGWQAVASKAYPDAVTDDDVAVRVINNWMIEHLPK